MPFKWDAENERNLLIFAIGEMGGGPPSTIWPAVAEKLGHGLNASACSQKFYKLKRESEKLLGDNGTTTPKPTSARKTSGSGSAANKRKKAQSDANEDTPTKRVKKDATKKATVKDEDFDENSEEEKKIKVSDQEDE